jgi:hypothetical protein
MSDDAVQHCPLCGTEVYPSKRYPRHLCLACSKKAVDENGRPLLFHNESISGGFIAKYADTGEPRDSHICYIDGHKCWADEEYMGSIVIQPVTEQPGPQT